MDEILVSDILLLPILIGALITTLYLIISTKKNDNSKDWNFNLKKIWAFFVLMSWKKKLAEKKRNEYHEEEVRMLKDEFDCDSLIFWGSGTEGTTLFVELNKKHGHSAEVVLFLKTPDGSTFSLPNEKNCIFYNALGNDWKAGDLHLTCLEPFSSWRINFNGLLINKTKGNNISEHVKLNFIWKASSEPMKYPDDCSNKILAESIALESWKDPHWMHGITKLEVNGYEQFGSLIGSVNFTENEQTLILNLPGLKSRQWGLHRSVKLDKSLTIMGRTTEGYVFIINKSSYRKQISNAKYGYLRFTNGEVLPIDWTDIDDVNLDEKSPPNALNVKFSVGSKKFTTIIHLNNVSSTTYSAKSNKHWNQLIIPFDCGLNACQGSGIITSWNRRRDHIQNDNHDALQQVLFWHKLKDINDAKLCVSFSENEACCPEFVGAKGASLALLYSKSSREYKVPNGFCLSTNGLKIQIESNEKIKEAISEIESTTSDFDDSRLRNKCEKVVELLKETKIVEEVENEVRTYFNNLKKSLNVENARFAVRSSGIGEDSEELSAAGQNSTILGCKNIEDTLKGIQECWSSLYAYQSVEYRRQHGQVVNCGMGVVIQTMVDANSAGVMFSRHPNTGNPKEILITSNYGLGETVVSGHVEPDTIILENDGQGSLKIKEKVIGKKSHKIIMDESGTKTENLNEELGKSCSLSDSQCLQLGKLALLQENLWGAARDIEWAIVKDEIYLLQARPITSINQWTEVELLHEFDSSIMSECDLLTFGNTGEVLPGALSPLSLSVVASYLNIGICHAARMKFSKYFLSTLYITHHHVALNVFNVVLRKVENTISTSDKIASIAVFGRPIIDDYMHSIAVMRHGFMSVLGKIKFYFKLISWLWRSKRSAEKSTSSLEKFQIDVDKKSTSYDMYVEIDKAVNFSNEYTIYHNVTSSASVCTQMVFLSTLLEGKTDFTTENFIDISTVLSSCNDVISAEIPEGLRKLSEAIQKSDKHQEFTEIDSSQAVNWLENNCPDIHKLLQAFLQKHGHRCIREFDLIEEPWGLNPAPLMKSIQTSVKYKINSKDSTENNQSVEELVSKLKSPINDTTKKILKFIIPMCRNAVMRRETTKSNLILLNHKLRLAYIALGQQMVKEWRLPTKDLIFFMAHHEILKYIKTRNPSYISRSVLRKRYFKKWQTFSFAEMNFGVPKPINLKDESYDDVKSEHKVLGSPVYAGQVVGRACVIKHFNEVDQIQSGDILITVSTDVGWSPFFPLLNGVVTELGGLISHGAVVAREYGLPCIVGAQGATSMFKTDDTVILDATNGFIARVEKKEK